MLYHEVNTCDTAPNLTGIPPHVALLNQVAVLTAAVEASTQTLTETIRTELDRRSVGGPVFAANNFIDSIKDLQRQLTEALQITQQQQVVPTALDTTTSVMAPLQDDPQHQMYYWGGRFHNIPEHFIIPKMNLQTLIIYWYCGSRHPVVPPLKYAKSWDFRNSKTMKVCLCQMKRLMNEVTRAIGYVNFDLGPSGRIDSPEKATRLYESISYLFQFPSNNQIIRRFSAMTWKTVFLDLQKNSFKFVGEEA